MTARLTKQEFVSLAQKIHGDRYDYSRVEYRQNKVKIKIICSEHGIFEQTPNDHLSGCGCFKCGKVKAGKSQSKSIADNFVSRAAAVHLDRYDYSLVQYRLGNVKVKIICPDHGIFEQTPTAHMGGNGCAICGDGKKGEIKSKFAADNFVSRSADIHSGRYDYSLVQYHRSGTKVKIICPEHGIFEQSPHHHLVGKGCYKCGKIKAGRSQAKSVAARTEFVDRSQAKHGNKYDYSRSVYVSSVIKLEVICLEHGSFYITPSNHATNGHGCPHCAGKAKLTAGKKERAIGINVGRSIRSNLDRLQLKNPDGYSTSKFAQSISAQIIAKFGDYGSMTIDHIVPQSFFNLSDLEELKLCWHIDNLRLLSLSENMSRGNRMSRADIQLITKTNLAILAGASRRPEYVKEDLGI